MIVIIPDFSWWAKPFGGLLTEIKNIESTYHCIPPWDCAQNNKETGQCHASLISRMYRFSCDTYFG